MISNDTAQQTDGESCGVYVIANVYCILNSLLLTEIHDVKKCRYWIRNYLQDHARIKYIK